MGKETLQESQDKDKKHEDVSRVLDEIRGYLQELRLDLEEAEKRGYGKNLLKLPSEIEPDKYTFVQAKYCVEEILEKLNIN